MVVSCRTIPNPTLHISQRLNVFGKLVIICGLQPPTLPDLNLCAYYLKGILNDKVICTIHILCKNCMSVRAEKVIMFQNKSSIMCQEIFSDDVTASKM